MGYLTSLSLTFLSHKIGILVVHTSKTYEIMYVKYLVYNTFSITVSYLYCVFRGKGTWWNKQVPALYLSG